MNNSQFIFIDSRVHDVAHLLVGLVPGVQVVMLDPNRDGVAQIAAALKNVHHLASIQVVSHGSSGALYLGNTVLDEASLGTHQSRLATIGAALVPGGDLLLYGCEVAAGSVGQSFIESLARATGADVAASTDATGSAIAGGNWILESATGQIEARSAISTAAQASYDHALQTISGTAGDDLLVGTNKGDFIFRSKSFSRSSGMTIVFGTFADRLEPRCTNEPLFWM